MKYIYLDQMIWSIIGKNMLGLSNNKFLEKLINFIKNKVDSKEWCLVFSFVNYYETAKNNSDTTIEAIKKAIINLSAFKNFLKIRYDILLDEIFVFNTDKKYKKIDFIEHHVLPFFESKDVSLCGYEEEFIDDVKNNEIIINLMLDNILKYSDISFKKENEIINNEMVNERKIYQKIGLREFTVSYFRNQYNDIIELPNNNNKLNKYHVIYNTINDDDVYKLCTSLPSFDTFIKLRKCIFDEKGNIDKNDWLDIDFLMVAIPYCDIIITEKKWCNRIKQLKLDIKYNTLCLSDITKLLEI